MIMRTTIRPKAVQDIRPVWKYCPDCKKNTLHVLFQDDAPYTGPVVLMPLSKLRGKRYHWDCARCLNPMPITDEESYVLESLKSILTPDEKRLTLSMEQYYKSVVSAVNQVIGYSDLESRHWVLAQKEAALSAHQDCVQEYLNTQESRRTKKCSVCGELIKENAVKCRFCGAEQPRIGVAPNCPKKAGNTSATPEEKFEFPEDLGSEIEQIQCPMCNNMYDIDYPECPFCQEERRKRKTKHFLNNFKKIVGTDE